MKPTEKDTTSAAASKPETASQKVADTESKPSKAVAQPAKEDARDQLAKSMVGQWQSACFPSNGSFAQLTFDIKAAQWHLDYKSFADKDCKTGTMTTAIDGPWELTQASKVGDGVYEAEFGFAQRSITPHMEGAVKFLSGLKPCGGSAAFEVGTSKSIHADGCPNIGMYPAEKCATDFDIATVKDGMLFFGQRPKDNNMCTAEKRPTKLIQYGFKRI